MAIQKGNKFLCGFCGKEYSKVTLADSCQMAHNLIYFPMTPTEVNRLLNFIYSKNEAYLDVVTIERLAKYARQAVRLDKTGS